MSRYGDKTRSGEPVGNAGQRQTSGSSGALTVTEQTFNSPGTWTWPGKCTFVEVLVVGGGGGGQNIPVSGPSPSTGTGGGGGAVVRYSVPVSAPVSVTVGAGGAGSPTPNGNGGTSAFGPLPAGQYYAGGGMGADGGTVTNQPYGGSGISGQILFGRYGSAGSSFFQQTGRTGGGAGGYLTLMGGMSLYGYGGGNGASTPSNFPLTDNGLSCGQGSPANGTDVLANTGHGGTVKGPTGGAGGSGIVIVRWME